MPTLVPCSQCEKINRLSISRAEAESPICGACKSELPIDHGVVHLTGTSLQHMVDRSPLPIIADFWAPNCLPCRAFEPEFQRSARQYEGKLIFGSLNTLENFLAADQYRIRSVPTLIYFSGGNEIERRFGALSSAQLNHWLEIISGGFGEGGFRSAA